MHSFRVVLVVLAMLGLGACAQTNFRAQDALARGSDGVETPRILVMPVDVVLSELSFGGYPSPRADWTQAARATMAKALELELSEAKVDFVNFVGPETLSDEVAKILRMNAAVGESIKAHQYDGPAALPTKRGTFDWSLGPEVAALREGTNANYGLFFHVRDSYSSGARVAAQVVAAVVFGVGLQGGIQVGLVSLVDLETGKVVWFNRLLRGEGDLRTDGPARETMKMLLTGMPK